MSICDQQYHSIGLRDKQLGLLQTPLMLQGNEWDYSPGGGGLHRLVGDAHECRCQFRSGFDGQANPDAVFQSQPIWEQLSYKSSSNTKTSSLFLLYEVFKWKIRLLIEAEITETIQNKDPLNKLAIKHVGLKFSKGSGFLRFITSHLYQTPLTLCGDHF